MHLYIYHGRLSPKSGPTDEDGNERDDWGFYGPKLEGVTGFHTTYFDQGHFNVYFENKAARDAAFELTGWELWDDNALTVAIDDGCLKRWNKERRRWEYFGDWGME